MIKILLLLKLLWDSVDCKNFVLKKTIIGMMIYLFFIRTCTYRIGKRHDLIAIYTSKTIWKYWMIIYDFCQPFNSIFSIFEMLNTYRNLPGVCGTSWDYRYLSDFFN